MTDPRQLELIRKYLHAIDLCMADEGIDGHTRRRIRNRFLVGDPAGDPHAQIPELAGPLRQLGTAGQETAGMPPEPASNEPTPPDEGPTTPDPLGDALRATGIKVEDIDPTALREALVTTSGPPWGQG